MDRYIASRASLKPSSVYMLKYARRVLVEYFGADKPIADVTEGDAELFREHVRKSVSQNPRPGQYKDGIREYGPDALQPGSAILRGGGQASAH